MSPIILRFLWLNKDVFRFTARNKFNEKLNEIFEKKKKCHDVFTQSSSQKSTKYTLSSPHSLATSFKFPSISNPYLLF